MAEATPVESARDEGLDPERLVIACLLGGFAFGMAVLFPWGSTQRFFSRGVSCSVAGLIVALPAAVLLWLLARRGAVLAAGRLGASIGLLAGLVGAAVLQAHCPLLEAEHMTVWHTAIPAVSTAAGYACGRLAGQPRDCTAETRRHREK